MPLAARSAMTRTAAAAAAAAANSSSNATTHPAPAESPQTTEPPPPQQQQPVPDTPPTNPAPSRADRKRSHKKKGRNQYTRDRDGNDDDSPARSLSRDIQKDDNGGGSNGGNNGPAATKSTGGDGGGGSGGHGKSGTKNKGGMSSKITMTDLKRRATALLDFISRTQVELAGEMTPTGSDEGGEKANGEPASPGEKHPDRDEKPSEASAAPVLNGDASQGKDFKDLGCMEMMDSLTRRLVKWQQEYAS